MKLQLCPLRIALAVSCQKLGGPGQIANAYHNPLVAGSGRLAIPNGINQFYVTSIEPEVDVVRLCRNFIHLSDLYSEQNYTGKTD